MPEARKAPLKAPGTAAQRLAPQNLRGRAKAVLALDLRKSGASWDQIVKANIGYGTRQAAFKACRDLLRNINTETADEARALLNGRYDEMLRPIWPRVLAGDLNAIEVALKIEALRMRLYGFDRPEVRATVNVGVGLDTGRIDSWSALMRSAQTAIETSARPAEEVPAEPGHELEAAS